MPRLALTLAILALPTTTFAQDDGGGLETWVGGAVAGGAYVMSESGFQSADAVQTQAEVDGAIGWGWGHVRLDLDIHPDFDLLANGGGTGALAEYPSEVYFGDTAMYGPEWAMLQLGREQVHGRFGVFNPNIGVEDWDVWNNYAGTYSAGFTYAGGGRFLGGEGSYTTSGGYDLAVFGGYDLDWSTYGAGVSLATEQDAFSTWSGLLFYPKFGVCPTGGECYNALAHVSVEVYPADPLWLTFETVTGVKDGSVYSSNMVVANVLPEATVNPFARGELVVDADEAIQSGMNAAAVIGARTDAIAWLRVMAEARSTFYKDGTTDIGGGLVVALHVPEPYAYSYADPFGEEEE